MAKKSKEIEYVTCFDVAFAGKTTNQFCDNCGSNIDTKATLNSPNFKVIIVECEDCCSKYRKKQDKKKQ